MSATADAPSLALGFEGDALAVAHPHGRPFWQAAAQGVLLLPRCRACGRAHWYPRPFCPFCHSEQVEWERAAGFGIVVAATGLARTTPARIVAYVGLDEGPVLLTNLIGCDLDAVPIGQRVAVAFQLAPEGRMVPVFAPHGLPG